MSKIVKIVSVACLAFLAGLVNAETLNKDGEWKSSGISVKRGEEHTFWITGLNGDQWMSLDVEGVYTYKEDGETYEDSVYPFESVTVENAEGGEDIYVLLTAEDWEWVPESVKSIKFYAYVSGFYDEEVSANNRFSFGHASGRDKFPGDQVEVPTTPLGTETNPNVLQVKMLSANDESIGSVEFELLEEHEGSYYIRISNLVKGQKYRFGYAGSSSSSNGVVFTMNKQGGSANLFDSAKAYPEWENCDAAYELVMEEGGTYEFVISGGVTGDMFTFYHAGLPKLTPANHSHEELAAGMVSAEFAPGYMNDPAGYAYDDIIDQKLFKVIGYKKGDNLIFRTEGADRPLLMQLYDSKGNVLATNRYMDDSNANVSIAWTATANYAAGTAVYVGVCQRLEDGEEPADCNVKLTIQTVELLNDTVSLTVVPDAAKGNPVDANGEPSAPRAFGTNEWVHTYVIAARMGVTYRVKAVCGDASGLKLDSEVYTLSGTGASARRTLLTAAKDKLSGSLDPETDGYLEFTASANANIYIDVYVADMADEWGNGKGLDYGPYMLYASAPGESLGVLSVPMMGAPESDMGWKILSGPGIAATKEVFYASGSSVLLAAGEYKLVAKEVKGFAKPDAKGYAAVTVEAGIAPTVAPTFKYTDTFDPLDDSPDTKAKHPSLGKAYAPAKLAPTSAKPVEAFRSLWIGDENDVDWFTLSAAAGNYYRFTFSEKTGAPKIAVYGPDNWTDECEYVIVKDPLESVQICASAKGTYYVKVSHDVAMDSSYTLKSTMAAPGCVKFAKLSQSVKDDVKGGYVDLKVQRTGKDGIVRVKYRTIGEQTGIDDAYYFPTNGVLEWASGDSKDKTIRVKIVPNHAWTADKTVKVLLEAFSDDDETFDPSNEYVAVFETDKKTGLPLDTATITMTASAKKAPGTIQVSGTDNPKKPVFYVTAGETVTVPIERISGHDGVVGMTVATVKGTAVESVDYASVTENLVWNDGDASQKTVTIETHKNDADYTAEKKFTLKFTALTSKKGDLVQYDKPTLASASVEIRIVNDKFADTVANYAKSLPKAGGVQLKEEKSGTMFVNEDGSIYSPDGKGCTFTLTGPGRFTFKLSADMSVTVGKSVQTFAAGETTAIYVQSGSQTVKFQGAEGFWKFELLDNGLPYLWEPLSDVTLAAPTVDKAVVAPGAVELCFKREDGVSYRVYALSSGAKNSANKAMKLGDSETEIASDDGVYFIDAEYNSVNKGKYTWKVDSYFEGGSVTNVSKKTFNLVVANVPEDKELPLTAVVGNGVWGDVINAVGGTNIVLKQGVKASFAVGAPTSTVKSVAGKLPDGLKLEVDKVTKQTYLRGTPTKAGAFQTLLQETGANKVAGTTTVLDIAVESAGSSVGTFNGLAMTYDTTNGAPAVASVSFTAAATGKLSAKVSIAGKSYTFADTGYSYVTGVPDDPSNPVEMHAELSLVSKVGSGKDAVTVTNWLYCVVCDLPENDSASWIKEGSVEIFMAALPDAKGNGFQEDILYSGKIYRDNSKLKEWQAAVAPLAGYYTISLVPADAFPGCPRGNGYLTLTLDAKGKVKVAGVLADGTKYAGAANAAIAVFGDGIDYAVRVPVYHMKGTMVFGGWITLRRNDKGELVASLWDLDREIMWNNDDPKSTNVFGYGFSMNVLPVGGWYDTVLNLQRAYIESNLSVSIPEGEDALEDIRSALELGDGYEFVASPSGQMVELLGNTLSVEKQKLVKDSSKKLNDWTLCTNAANVTIKFNRKTGIVEGTFDVWYEGENDKGVFEQKTIKGIKHYGIITLARDDSGYLDDDVLSSGFCLVPLKLTEEVETVVGGRPSTKKESWTWNASYRFDIGLTPAPCNWVDFMPEGN